MPGSVQLAVAGSGKTEEIVSRIKGQDPMTRSLALTYTVNGQNEIIHRSKTGHTTNHETAGWMSFLVRHVVRPYLPAIFPTVQANGLCFVNSSAEIPNWRSGWKYYFNDAHQPYSARLAMLAKKVLKETRFAAIERLELIYDAVYIDECQDLTPSDIFIVEALMKSSIDVFATGDVRQAVLKTTKSDRYQKQYNGVEQVNLFREMERKNICDLSFSRETTRFNQKIANFSDQVHDPDLKFPLTTSLQDEITGHDGVYLVDLDDVDSYIDKWSPTILRYKGSATANWPVGESMNFAVSKGLTRDRVIIFTTGTIDKWLCDRTLLKPDTACGFYVAVTRARFSVAIAVKNAPKAHSKLDSVFRQDVTLWSPIDQ